MLLLKGGTYNYTEWHPLIPRLQNVFDNRFSIVRFSIHGEHLRRLCTNCVLELFPQLLIIVVQACIIDKTLQRYFLSITLVLNSRTCHLQLIVVSVTLSKWSYLPLSVNGRICHF